MIIVITVFIWELWDMWCVYSDTLSSLYSFVCVYSVINTTTTTVSPAAPQVSTCTSLYEAVLSGFHPVGGGGGYRSKLPSFPLSIWLFKLYKSQQYKNLFCFCLKRLPKTVCWLQEISWNTCPYILLNLTCYYILYAHSLVALPTQHFVAGWNLDYLSLGLYIVTYTTGFLFQIPKWLWSCNCWSEKYLQGCRLCICFCTE